METCKREESEWFDPKQNQALSENKNHSHSSLCSVLGLDTQVTQFVVDSEGAVDRVR
jgi:hypothetical protein